MSTWNHRFIVTRDRFLDEDGEFIQLAEVFYDENGKLSAYARPHLIFDDMEGVNNFVLRIMKAAQLPLLHEDDFPSDGDLTQYKVYTDPFEDDEQ
jgi:hypothetical protein